VAKRIYDSDMIAAWANLSPQQRLADRAAALVFAAEQIRLMAEPEESGSGLTTALVEATTRVENEVRPMLDRMAFGPTALCAIVGSTFSMTLPSTSCDCR
jgi:hypothetical protein